MKILMYSVRDDEESAIKDWAAKNDVQVDTNDLEFHPETADLTKGYDGVVIQQRSAIGDDPTVYQKLADYGLKQITSRTAGVDTIDIPAAKAAGLTVTNVPAYSPNSVAEMAVTQTMRLIRNLELFDSRISQQNFQWAGLQAREIRSLTVGVIGAGRIGGTVAKLFHDLVSHAYDFLTDGDTGQLFLEPSAVQLLSFWCRTPQQMRRFIGIILNAKYAIEKAHKDLGVWINLDDPELKPLMTKTLRRYFNALRSNEKHIKNVENYLYGTMQNLFSIYWNKKANTKYQAEHPETGQHQAVLFN